MLQRGCALTLATIVGTGCASVPGRGQAKSVAIVHAPSSGWGAVQALPADAFVDVRLSDGSSRQGAVAAVDGESLTLTLAGPQAPIPRTSIVRVRHQLQPARRGSAILKHMAIGAATAGGVFTVLAMGDNFFEPWQVGALGALYFGAPIGAVSGAIAGRARWATLYEVKRVDR
ncbi:MAG: hypothetical protein ACRD09_15870 [Vicinamibacterales bacterium]